MHCTAGLGSCITCAANLLAQLQAWQLFELAADIGKQLKYWHMTGAAYRGEQCLPHLLLLQHALSKSDQLFAGDPLLQSALALTHLLEVLDTPMHGCM